MKEYNGTSAYDFSYFEPQTEGTSAVKRERPAAPKQIKRAAENSAVSSTVKKSVAIVAACMLMVVCLLAMRSKCDALNSEIDKANKELKISMSENVRLTAELNSMISVEKIEDYAENVLGMSKMEPYQITYIDLSEGDEVVVSGNRSVDSSDSFFAKVEEIFAYIF